VDWFLTHWQAILAAIVAIGTPVSAVLMWSKPLLRWFQSRTKSKAQGKDGSLSFASKDLQCQWSGVISNKQSGTLVSGHWNVTNGSERDVVVLKARLSKYPSRLVQVSTHHPDDQRNIFGTNYPIYSGQMSEVSATFTFFPPIGRASKPIISDVIFTDNFGSKYRVPTHFSYIGSG